MVGVGVAFSAWEPSLYKQELDRMARLMPQGLRAGNGRNECVVYMELMNPVCLEVWPVLLQLLIVSGNRKELVLVIGAQTVPGFWVVLPVPAYVRAA